MGAGAGVRLVVFDLDGTLVDSAGDIATAVNATLARIAPGSPPLALDAVSSYIGNGAGRLLARSLSARGIDVRPEDALPFFLEYYRECLLDTTRLYPGVLETLDALSGRALTVLTNKPGDMSRTILEGLGVAGRFSRIWGAGDVPDRKPDPAGLLLLMREVGATGEQTVLVGDSAIDVRTGRAAGVRTIGVTYGLDPESLAAEPPDETISDLRELPRLI